MAGEGSLGGRGLIATELLFVDTVTSGGQHLLLVCAGLFFLDVTFMLALSLSSIQCYQGLYVYG